MTVLMRERLYTRVEARDGASQIDMTHLVVHIRLGEGHTSADISQNESPGKNAEVFRFPVSLSRVTFTPTTVNIKNVPLTLTAEGTTAFTDTFGVAPLSADTPCSPSTDRPGSPARSVVCQNPEHGPARARLSSGHPVDGPAGRSRQAPDSLRAGSGAETVSWLCRWVGDGGQDGNVRMRVWPIPPKRAAATQNRYRA